MKEIKWVNLLLELFVVIIGVTIAFSLDSWKENKKSHTAEKKYLESFEYDLQKDTANLKTLIDTLEYQMNNCGLLIECINKGDFTNDNLLDYSISLFFVTTFTPHSATYKSLASSGKLETISNFELQKKIVNLYDIDYSKIQILDEFAENQVFNYRMPFLHDNLQYTRGRIENTNVLQTSKYINITYSAYYFLGKQIEQYTTAKEDAKQLIKSIEEYLNKN